MQRTCQRLHASGFEEINTIECLRRVHDFRYQHRNKIRFTADEQQEQAAPQPDESDETTESEKRELTEDDGEQASPTKKKKHESTNSGKKATGESESILTAVGPLVMPGHTGFLTFAYLRQM